MGSHSHRGGGDFIRFWGLPLWLFDDITKLTPRGVAFCDLNISKLVVFTTITQCAQCDRRGGGLRNGGSRNNDILCVTLWDSKIMCGDLATKAPGANGHCRERSDCACACAVPLTVSVPYGHLFMPEPQASYSTFWVLSHCPYCCSPNPLHTCQRSHRDCHFHCPHCCSWTPHSCPLWRIHVTFIGVG